MFKTYILIKAMQEDLKVALVQTHLHWENPIANRLNLQEKLQEIETPVDLIVLPEMFTTGFTMTPQHVDEVEAQQTLSWMQEMAKKHEAIVVGSQVFSEDGDYFNRLFCVDANGVLGQYDKRHTFTLAGENTVYQKGKTRLQLEVNGFTICPLICYDLRFPVWSRNVEDYDVVLYVANWPSPRISAWDALLKARAIENMAYCIGVNRIGLDPEGHEYPGHSSVYDVLGNQVAFSEKEEIIIARLSKSHITKYRNKLKFLDDQDSFIVK
ncbi:MAG: nitrilase family protein [Bacteroidota bacterium]